LHSAQATAKRKMDAVTGGLRLPGMG